MLSQETLTKKSPFSQETLTKIHLLYVWHSIMQVWEKVMSYKVGEKIRKTFPIAAFILALLFSILVGGQLVKLGTANPYHEERWADPPIILIHSPANETCVNNAVLNFTVTKPEWWVGTLGINGHAQTFDGVTYTIDGNFYGAVDEVDSNLTSPLTYFVYLTNLTDGTHRLTVYAYATGSVWEIHGLWDYSVPVNSSSTVFFTLDTTFPTVSILSLENKTYYSTNVTLAFAISEYASVMRYCLDGTNVTIAGNMTLVGLSVGPHNLIVYAEDAAGNVGASKTIVFRIEESFPTVPVATASAVSAAIIGVGLLVYFKKRNHPS